MIKDAFPSAGEIRALAGKLLAWANQLAERNQGADDLADSDRQKLFMGLGEATLQVRSVRARIFAGVPLQEPVWDVLLNLFMQEIAGHAVSIDDLACDTRLSRVTVGMCIDMLVDSGMAKREPDPANSRNVFWLKLTADGKARMQEMLLEFLGPRQDSKTGS